MTRRKHHRYAAEAKAAERSDREPHAGTRCPGCEARMVRIRERRTGRLADYLSDFYPVMVAPPWFCLACAPEWMMGKVAIRPTAPRPWGGVVDRADLRAHFRDKLFARPAPRAAVVLVEAP